MLSSRNEYTSSVRLPAIIEFSRDAIIGKTLDGIISDWNPAAEKLFGFSSKEAVGKHISFIIPDYLKEEEERIGQEIKERKQAQHFQTVRLRKDQAFVATAITVAPIKNEQDEVVGSSELIHDIRSLQEEQDRQAMLAAIVNSSEDAVISKTLEGIVTSWNHAAEKLFGYKASEMIGEPITRLFPASRISEETEILSKIARGIKVEHFETVRIKKNGEEVHCSLTISPIRNSSNEIIGASKIARDISHRVKAEKKLKEYASKLEELNKYKSDFIGIASHELKTPLTSVKAYLQLLESGTYDKATEEKFVAKALLQVKRLENLIEDLLDTSRIENGKIVFHKRTFNFEEVLCEAIEVLEYSFPDYHISREGNADINIYGDASRIEQVIINYLSNAIKYSPNNKAIQIRTWLDKGRIYFSVEDRGIGISKEDQQKLFSKFYRVEKSSRGFQGLGIGLYICAEIIRRHDGELGMKSELGKGSTFYFSLPLPKN